MKKFCKYSQTECAKCGSPLKFLGTFEGRPRWYCYGCEEEILDFPWSSRVPYPQDNGNPSPSVQEGFR